MPIPKKKAQEFVLCKFCKKRNHLIVYSQCYPCMAKKPKYVPAIDISAIEFLSDDE